MTGESRSVVVRLSLDTAQAIRSSKEFGDEFGRALDHAEKRTQSTRAAVDQLTSTTGKVALAAGAALGAIVAKTANFDEAMSHVAATGDDARSSIDALRQAAIQAGQDTAFSATEAAGGIENLEKAGVSAKDILGGGLKGSLDLAAAGGLEVADAAEVAATALTQFKLQGADVPHVADLLAAAAGKAQGDVSDMSMALKQSGLVASQMGLSIEETTGTLAAFASAGLLGSDAGTSFRTMLLRLANPTNESADLMAQLGIQAYDAQGKFVGMASVAGQLRAALEDKTQAERDSALATIFGSDAIRAASVLYKQGAEGITDWTGKVDDAGYAAETAATRMDNLKGDLEQFMGSLETAMIGAGEGSQGPLRKLVQGATDAVNEFNQLPGPVQSSVTALLGLVAVTAGAAWFGAKVIRGISDTRTALDQLGVSAGKTTGKLARIGATGGTILIAAQAIGALANATLDMGNAVESADVERNLEAIASGTTTDDLQKLASALEGVNEAGGGTVNALLSVPSALTGIKTSFETNKDTVEQFDQALASMVESGHAEEAAAAFQQIRDAAAENGGVSDNDVVKSFDAYGLALKNVESAAKDAAVGTNALVAESDQLQVKQRQAAARAKELKNALADQRDEARTTARDFITLGDSLDNGKKSLGEWLHELEKQAQALRDFTSNAQTAAHRGLDKGLIASLEEAGSAGALRMKQLANATDSEIDRANRAWRKGQDAIRDYVAMKVPPKKITVDTSQAKMSIADIQTRLAGLHSKTIAIDIATGGGPGHSAGGYTGDGGKFQPAGYVHRGEFVFSKEATDGNVAMLDSLHKGLRGYADGGLVGAKGFAAGGYAHNGAGGTPYMPDVLDLSWLVGLDRLGERELHRRENIAEREERLAEKSLKQEQDRLDEERAALKDLRDARRQFMQDVTGNFRADIFGGIDLAQAGANGLLGSDFGNSVYAFYQQQMANGGTPDTQGYNIADWVQQYLDTLSQQQLAVLQAQATTGQLHQDTFDADAFEQVLEQLRAMGLRGGAYSQLAASGNLAQAQAYLQMGPGFIQSLMQDFRRREHALQNLGQSVGNARFGADIRDQTKLAHEAKRQRDEARDLLHRIEQGQRSISRELAEIKREHPKKIGDAVGDKLDNAVTHGQQRGPRG